MNATTFIYTLNCPVTGAVRYVGKTNNLIKRLAKHLKDRDFNHRTTWIQHLQARGFEPRIELIDEVPDCEWPMWEVAYIQFFREGGCDLVNGTDGGENPPSWEGNKHSAKACTAISEGKKGDKNPNFGKKTWNYGIPCSPERKSAISIAKKGKPNILLRKPKSAEHCAAISAGKRGKPCSPETCAARRGKRHSIEHRAKNSATQKVRWAIKKAAL